MTAPKTRRPSLTWIVVAIVILVVALGFLYLTYARRANAPTNDTQPDTSQAPSSSTEPQTSQPATGSYQTYSQPALQQATGRKVLFFHASWCPQCRAIEQDINEQGVPSDMTIFKVDYDNSADLKMKYGVTLQTTFVEVDSGGELIKKHVAYNQPTLPAVLEALGD